MRIKSESGLKVEAIFGERDLRDKSDLSDKSDERTVIGQEG